MRQAGCALISVSDKKGVENFARGLASMGVTIISTGGTAECLRRSGIEVVEVTEFTGSPELLGGRVKTLHPKIHAGILASRDSEAHRLEMSRLGFEYIDIVVVNLPAPKLGEAADMREIMGEMDIGGHALLRAAAKNFKDVIVISNPARYELVLEEFRSGEGTISDGLKARLAREALEASARYDAIYHGYLRKMVAPATTVLPSELRFDFPKMRDLRYGENPHQRAAVYRNMEWSEPSVMGAVLLHGKELSFNNYADLDAALEIIKGFHGPASAIVKHANPCGVAIGEGPLEAYRRALATDPDSAFGGIVGFNTRVGEDVATALSSTYLECVIAPGFDDDALSVLKKRKNLRILEVPQFDGWRESGGRREPGLDARQITGGMLLQERDLGSIGLGDLRHVTVREPTAREAKAIFFAWSVARSVRSNAIVIAAGEETVGIGAGQMSRVDAARLAVTKARKPIKECVAASDGFFPFRDAVDLLARAGVKTIVQPGGSKRDEEVIAACNELGVAMVFTGMRCFRH